MFAPYDRHLFMFLEAKFCNHEFRCSVPYLGCRIIDKLLLFTHRKSYMDFYLVLKWLIWNNVNGILAIISCYFFEFHSFGANLVTVVEVKPILSATKM